MPVPPEVWREPELRHANGRALWWQNCKYCGNKFANEAPEPHFVCGQCYHYQMTSHMRQHNDGIFTSLTAKIAYGGGMLVPNHGDQDDK